MKRTLAGLAFVLVGLTASPALAVSPFDCPAIPGMLMGQNAGVCYFLSVNADGSINVTTVPTGTQDVNVAKVDGVTTSTGAGATGTGSQRTTVAQDSTTVAGSATLPAGTNVIGKIGFDLSTPGTTNGVVVNSSALPTGAATAANQTNVQAAPTASPPATVNFVTLVDKNGNAIDFTSASPTISTSQYPNGATPITGNATGTTGAVVGTLAGTSGKTTYICGWDASAVGGTAAVGPITVAGIKTSSMVYQLNSAAAPVQTQHNYFPCVPASATNTSITITTTADGTATAVDVNSWGYQL